jgi:hypothetical protein
MSSAVPTSIEIRRGWVISDPLASEHIRHDDG